MEGTGAYGAELARVLTAAGVEVIDVDRPPQPRRRPDREHTIVLVRIRVDERAHTYVERRTKDGLSKKDIMRCLKRFAAREVYCALTCTTTERITPTGLTPTA